METANKSSTATADRRQMTGFYLYESDDDSRARRERLNVFRAANAELFRENEAARAEREAIEESYMTRPFSTENAFAYFGVMLGALPVVAIFMRLLIDGQIFRNENSWILGIFFIVSLISATVGFFTGKSVGRMVSRLEQASWSRMILALPFVGLGWGILAGGAGGIIIFVVGALFGAFIGGAVGAIALPVFAVFHRLVKRGERIDARHFLPLALGTTLTIMALFLGL